jgi:hypothetical protein
VEEDVSDGLEAQEGEETGRVRAQTCTDHCSACGAHFHGLAAFDKHLKRVNESAKGERPYYELEHLSGEDAGLHAWTTSGRCDFAGNGMPVTIWQMPGSAERMAAAGFGKH